MAKYQIWNRTDDIITPSGAVFTPEQWMEKHPFTKIEKIKVVISGEVINGALLMEFTGMVKRAEKNGCDFSDCVLDQEYLDRIEAFEIEMETKAKADAQAKAEAEALEKAKVQATQERIAADLELLALTNMPDVEDEI